MCAPTLVEKAIENVLSSFNIAAVFFRCCCCCWSAIGHTVYFILIELNNINLQAALCEYRFDLNRFKLILRYLTNSRRTSRQAVPKSFTRCCLRHCYWWFRNRREELCLNFFLRAPRACIQLWTIVCGCVLKWRRQNLPHKKYYHIAITQLMVDSCRLMKAESIFSS